MTFMCASEGAAARGGGLETEASSAAAPPDSCAPAGVSVR